MALPVRQGLKCAGNVRVLFRLGGLAHRDYLRRRLLQILLHLGQRVPLLGLVDDGVPFEHRQAIVPGNLHGHWHRYSSAHKITRGRSAKIVDVRLWERPAFRRARCQ